MCSSVFMISHDSSLPLLSTCNLRGYFTMGKVVNKLLQPDVNLVSIDYKIDYSGGDVYSVHVRRWSCNVFLIT